MRISVGADNKITVHTYRNAVATIVQTDPLKFTVLNDRGMRTMTFTWHADNFVTITGPRLDYPNLPVRSEGNCKRVS